MVVICHDFPISQPFPDMKLKIPGDRPTRLDSRFRKMVRAVGGTSGMTAEGLRRSVAGCEAVRGHGVELGRLAGA